MNTSLAIVKPFAVFAVLVAPVATLSACGEDQPESQPSPSGTTTTTTQPPRGERLTTQLKAADGRPVANANFEFADGYATVTVETVAEGILTPGFHGMHIHAVGKCEPNSVAPTGGSPGNFNSAGGHFQVPGHTEHPASGDLPSLLVRSDGSARLVATTNAFTAQDLSSGEKTALIIHEGPDNFANIPPRYTQSNGAPGPDQETLATGDSGGRVACGVIGGTAATGTTTTTTTATAVPSPTGPAATTPAVSPAQPSPTDTVTVTVPTSPARRISPARLTSRARRTSPDRPTSPARRAKGPLSRHPLASGSMTHDPWCSTPVTARSESSTTKSAAAPGTRPAHGSPIARAGLIDA
jgi:superoxide dismutase, Cu-Zn family